MRAQGSLSRRGQYIELVLREAFPGGGSRVSAQGSISRRGSRVSAMGSISRRGSRVSEQRSITLSGQYM